MGRLAFTTLAVLSLTGCDPFGPDPGHVSASGTIYLNGVPLRESGFGIVHWNANLFVLANDHPNSFREFVDVDGSGAYHISVPLISDCMEIQLGSYGTATGWNDEPVSPLTSEGYGYYELPCTPGTYGDMDFHFETTTPCEDEDYACWGWTTAAPPRE